MSCWRTHNYTELKRVSLIEKFIQGQLSQEPLNTFRCKKSFSNSCEDTGKLNFADNTSEEISIIPAHSEKNINFRCIWAANTKPCSRNSHSTMLRRPFKGQNFFNHWRLQEKRPSPREELPALCTSSFERLKIPIFIVPVKEVTPMTQINRSWRRENVFVDRHGIESQYTMQCRPCERMQGEKTHVVQLNVL